MQVSHDFRTGLPKLNSFTEVLENYQHDEMKRLGSGRKIELDVYIPALQLSFEYQGEQHYSDVYALGNKWSQSSRDREKELACKEKGITLIEIPYWWNKEKSSLMATIHKERPDLLTQAIGGEAIPKEPPSGFPQGKE
jgi:hypothetical protein